MFKSITKGLLIGAMALGFATTAGATVYEVNIYGASAQYKFWTSAAPAYHAFKNCAAGDIYKATGKVMSRDNGIAVCAGQDGFGGLTGQGYNGDQDTYVIRYSTNASYDGIWSVQGLDYNATQECAPNLGERYMADEGSTTWGTETITGLKCCDVTLGASDVAASTFKQKSHGQTLGNYGGAVIDRDITGIEMDPDFLVYRPIVVPFSFFSNVAVPDTVEYNMSRVMATSLFSGQVVEWQDYLASTDPEYNTAKQVVLCGRHAGSGTWATLDAAVMRGDYGLVQSEVKPTDFMHVLGLAPVVWFNNGSSDMMRCINTNGDPSYDGVSAPWTNGAAVGVADSDKISATVTPDPSSSYPNVRRMTYNGYVGDAENIQHGRYTYWSAQWLFQDDQDDQEIIDLCDDLAAFASDPSYNPVPLWWSAQDDMLWTKDNDFQQPYRK